MATPCLLRQHDESKAIDDRLNSPLGCPRRIQPDTDLTAVHLAARKRGHNRVSFAAWDLRRGTGAIYFWADYTLSCIGDRPRGECIVVHANDLRAADVQGGIPCMN